MSRRRLMAMLCFSLLGIAILVSLGIWQLWRWQAKEQLLQDLSARQSASAISLSEAVHLQARGQDIGFMHVKTQGAYQQQSTLYKLTSFEGQPGWEVITPFVSDEGLTVLVDRGTIPASQRPLNPAALAEHVALDALVAIHKGQRGMFDPDNEVELNNWYWWDIPAMLGVANLPGNLPTAPFILQRMASPHDKDMPVAQTIETGLHNNHLQYMLTWFLLALCLAAIAALFLYRQFRATRS